MKPQLLVAGLVFCLASCAADSYQRMPAPRMDVEVSSPEVARIYVLRLQQMRGAVRGVRIVENGDVVGRIGSDSFLCWERKPGSSVLEVFYEGPILDGESQTVVDVTCDAGQVFYLGITIDAAWNKPVARMLTKAEARSLLDQSTLAPAD